MIKGAIFDMDGTVLDSMPVWHHLSEDFMSQYGVRVTASDRAAIESGTQLAAAQYFTAQYPQLPLTAQEIVCEMNTLITARYEKIARPKEGVLPFLQELRARGVRCAIATLTSRHHAEKALRDHDMLQYFDFVLTIEDIGASKREPDIYLRAAQQLQCAVQECMVFEDAPYAAETAKRAGFLVCGITEPAYAAGEQLLRCVSDIVVERSFTEVHRLLPAQAENKKRIAIKKMM